MSLLPTGSATATNTIGIVLVARCAATTLSPQRHRALVMPVAIVLSQLGKAYVERGEVDMVLAPREVRDHVTARSRVVSFRQRAEVGRQRRIETSGRGDHGDLSADQLGRQRR